MNERKNELLGKIVELEDKISENTKVQETIREEVKDKQVVKDKLQNAYDEIKRQLDEVARTLRDSQDNLRYLSSTTRADSNTLDSLRRELGRLLDTEKINKDYINQVEAFNQACLDAPWRAENREDGRGALPHQIEGAIHLAIAKQALLGDKRGLGKSLTSLIWCDFVGAKRVIIICPSDTMDNYIREIKMWTPHRSPIKLGKMDRGMRDFLLPHLREAAQYMLVLNFEAWRKDKDYINELIKLEADTIIIDEAHHAKTLDSSTCRGIMDLRFGANQCECGWPRVKLSVDKYTAACACGKVGPITDFCSIKNVLPMTGTPILNRPQELYPHLRLIDPSNFRTEKDYLSDFCRQNENRHWTWQYGGERTLINKVGPRYLARDRKTAGVVVPPTELITHIITMAELEEKKPKQFRAYRQARDYAQIVLDPSREIVMSMPAKITVLLRLRQVLTWPQGIVLKWTNPDTEEQEAVTLDAAESIKVDKAEEIIREVVEEGERVVLFSQFKYPLHELARRLGPMAAIYDGSTSDRMKDEIARDFDPKTVSAEGPKYKVVLCNYKSAGEGLNFQGATQEIILDEEWNPGKQEQAYGRIDRMGQTRDTQIHTIRVEPSVDTWMAGLQAEKAALIGGFESEADMFRKAYDALRNGEM